MSLAGFKKQINKTSQFFSEKVGGAKGSELEKDFVDLCGKIDVINDCVEQMQGNTKAYLQPNPTARTKLAVQTSYQKARGQAKSAKYPQPEFNLAEVFINSSGGLNDNSGYALSLEDLGRGFSRLSEVKDAMEINVAQNFLEPLHELQQKDLREVNLHRKKLESRRLDYDYKKGKGTKVSEEELRVAEDKFIESKQLCYDSMMNFMDSDIEHIGQLYAFSEAIRDYHLQCATIMESVTQSVSKRLTEAASRPHTERLNMSVHTNDSCNMLSRKISNSDDQSQPSVQMMMTPLPVELAQELPRARALYDFEPENEGELKFLEGSIITLTSRVDENWLEGTVNGCSGYFPENYVEIIVPL